MQLTAANWSSSSSNAMLFVALMLITSLLKPSYAWTPVVKSSFSTSFDLKLYHPEVGGSQKAASSIEARQPVLTGASHIAALPDEHQYKPSYQAPTGYLEEYYAHEAAEAAPLKTVSNALGKDCYNECRFQNVKNLKSNFRGYMHILVKFQKHMYLKFALRR